MKKYKYIIYFIGWMLMSLNTFVFAQSYIVKGGYSPEEFVGGIFIGERVKLFGTYTIIVDGADSKINASW